MTITEAIALMCLSGGADLPDNFELQASHAAIEEICSCEEVHVATSKKLNGKRIHVIEYSE